MTATPLTAEIAQQARDPRVALAMLMGALLEGGSLSGPWGANLSDPYGGSYGPYQINGVHGLSPEQADNPQYATSYMLPAYQQAVAQVPAGLWETDPKTAAVQAVQIAERPGSTYPQSRVDAAWSQLAASAAQPAITLVGGPSLPGIGGLGNLLPGWPFTFSLPFGWPFSGPGTNNPPAPGLGLNLGNTLSGLTPGWAGSLGSLLRTLISATFWRKVGITVGAVLLGLVGVVLLMRRQVGEAAETMAKTAPAAAA